MRLDASALSRSGSKTSGSWVCSESVFRYEACAPVIGSCPVTQSSGSLIRFEFGSGLVFGLLASTRSFDRFADCCWCLASAAMAAPYVHELFSDENARVNARFLKGSAAQRALFIPTIHRSGRRPPKTRNSCFVRDPRTSLRHQGCAPGANEADSLVGSATSPGESWGDAG